MLPQYRWRGRDRLRIAGKPDRSVLPLVIAQIRSFTSARVSRRFSIVSKRGSAIQSSMPSERQMFAQKLLVRQAMTIEPSRAGNTP